MPPAAGTDKPCLHHTAHRSSHHACRLQPEGRCAVRTYNKLHHHVSRLANVLKSRGVKKGDRVCIYMPMIPEAAYAMLAYSRIGAVHSVVFGGFSPDTLRDRIMDADCRAVITADEGVRGGKYIPLKANIDKALQNLQRGGGRAHSRAHAPTRSPDAGRNGSGCANITPPSRLPRPDSEDLPCKTSS